MLHNKQKLSRNRPSAYEHPTLNPGYSSIYHPIGIDLADSKLPGYLTIGLLGAALFCAAYAAMPLAEANELNQNTNSSLYGSVHLSESGHQDKPILDAYIVSRCPYGLQMQRILSEIIKTAPKSKDFIKVRYLGEVKDGAILSMHGDTEAQENLRQMVLQEEQPDKYWPYIGCYMESGNTTKCLINSGVEQKKLNEGMKDPTRGLAYAQEDFGIANLKGVRSSPSLLVNGQPTDEFSYADDKTAGRSPEAVKRALCSGFAEKPNFCSVDMNGAMAATGISKTYSDPDGSSSASCGD